MNLWLLTVGLFCVGCALAALGERSRRTQPVTRTLAEAAGVFLAYVAGIGLLVAFNVFSLGMIDAFFTTSVSYVVGILYWPSAVLTFAPLVIGGVFVVVFAGARPPRRLQAFVVLLAASLAAFEAVALLGMDAPGIALVQTALFVAFAAVVYRAARRSRKRGFPDGPYRQNP